MRTIEELMTQLTEPTDRLIEDMKHISGDIMLLGAAGKMGPSLAILAVKALKKAGSASKVLAVSRFSDPETKITLEENGVETIQADLLNEDDLQNLPKVPNVLYMAGKKFGTSGNEGATWAMNSYLPGRVSEHFADSRIVVFSSGNIYPFLPLQSGGADESTAPDPVGEYAQSCLGRERIFDYFSRKNETKMLIYRLNYAVETRYGVLLEIAQNVYRNRPIDLTTGVVNVIWQGDANEYALRSLLHCASPPAKLNVTGPEVISIRWLAEQFGKLFDRTPILENSEAEASLLNNSSKAHRQFGYPNVSLYQAMEWIAEWVENGGDTLNKPTHFQERKGDF